MADLLPKMVEAGYPTAISGFYGLEGGIIDVNGIRCFPKIGDKWGSDAMVEHAKAFQSDVVFTLQDIWVVDPNMLRLIPRWIPIVPIDHEPVPEAIFQRLKLAYRVVTYSPFGTRELHRKGMHSTYIPHTVDTKLFKPMDKKEIRKKIGIPDDIFLFGMVSANKDNPPRKEFQRVMDAFVKFKQNHPKSGIYFHTLLEQGGGFNIKEYAKYLGISGDIYHVQPYEQLYGISHSDMPRIYNAFDCLLAPSSNEGFGVPLIEAQSCGVPVITNNFTSMPDLIKEGKTGFLTTVEHKRWTPLGAYIGHPSTDSIYDCMEKVYLADRKKMGKAARKFMQQEFDLDKVFKEKWIPYLQLLESEISIDTSKQKG
jgi:glycosyltransferase involved in cell wall biosynthesis